MQKKLPAFHARKPKTQRAASLISCQNVRRRSRSFSVLAFKNSVSGLRLQHCAKEFEIKRATLEIVTHVLKAYTKHWEL